MYNVYPSVIISIIIIIHYHSSLLSKIVTSCVCYPVKTINAVTVNEGRRMSRLRIKIYLFILIHGQDCCECLRFNTWLNILIYLSMIKHLGI